MNIGFEYTYKNSTEILEGIKKINDYSAVDYAIVLGLFIFSIAFIYFVLPIFISNIKEKQKKLQKKAKKDLINKVMIKSKIEEEIKKEIEAEKQTKKSKIA